MKKEGRLNLIGKYAKVELYWFFKGEIKKDFVKYEFGNYDEQDQNLTKLEHKLDKINKEYEKFIKKITDKKIIKKKSGHIRAGDCIHTGLWIFCHPEY